MLTTDLLTRYISQENILPRKIRGIGAGGAENDALKIVDGVPQWSPGGTIPFTGVIVGPRVSLSRTADFTVADNTQSIEIPWTLTNYDEVPDNPTFNMHLSNGAPQNIYAYIPEDGIYSCTCILPFDTVNDYQVGVRRVRLHHEVWNGTGYDPSVILDQDNRQAIPDAPAGAFRTIPRIEGFHRFSANDRVFIRVYQSSGSNAVVVGGAPSSGVPTAIFNVTKVMD